MSSWNVTLRRRVDDEWEYKSVDVDGEDEAEATAAALQSLPDEWEVESVDRLCDFCEPAPHPHCEAHTKITVIDPADVMNEPLGNDAPERTAWVCHDHLQVVKQLPTVRAQRASAENEVSES